MPQCCINPSILSADFVNLEAELQRISNADAVHVDVMDNHFVPNLTIGLPVVQRIQAVSPVPLDAHLMISDADRWAPGFADAGLASVTFHAEASIAPVKLARELRARGSKAGMALRPATAVEPYLDMLEELDMILIMTVEPGFGGQAFLDFTLPKIRKAGQPLTAPESMSPSRWTAASRRKPFCGRPKQEPTSLWRARLSTARRTRQQPSDGSAKPAV
ncbi:ribulose-phosphate 3-epimerase [Arthrobacter sp. Hiyo4]|nr:ribulose-phosphate 3-epimerase [Arthrobacter sp. Hiyo4]